ncbi:M48 family metalloprotease [bacterium]|nr:M48 family metalloprotease [bacterium]
MSICALFAAWPAQAEGMRVIRDAETEAVMKSYFRPILSAAGMSPDSVRIILVNDNTLNAFVAGGANLFFNTGLLVECESPAMVRGVMAHELGHITGGHLLRMQDELESATVKQIVTTLLAVMAGASGSAEAAQGIFMGGTQLTMYGLYAHSREQEQAADQAGVTFLKQSNEPIQGMLDVLQLLRSRERLSPQGGIPYLRSHPLTNDRISFVRNEAMQAGTPPEPDKAELAEHELMLGKLRGFLQPYNQVAMRYANKDTAPAHYAMAIAEYRRSKLEEALKHIARLKELVPNNAYIYETEGQILFENGRLPEAQKAYAKAYKLKPNESLIAIAYAHTMVDDTSRTDETLTILNRALEQDSDNLQGWRLMTALYQRKNQPAMAAWTQAESASLLGNQEQAKRFATTALKSLPKGSPAALQAQDVLDNAEEAIAAKRKK